MVNYTNDEYMTYDLSKHRYILSIDGYEKLTGEGFATDHGLTSEQATMIIKRASNIVYEYIYLWAKNRRRTEYEISLPKYREYIQEALVEMVSGLLANKTDVALFFNQRSSQNYRNTDTVTPQVKMILMNCGILTRAELPRLEEGYDKNRGVDY